MPQKDQDESGFGPPQDNPQGFGPPENPDAAFAQLPKAPLPELPNDFVGAVAETPQFLGELGQAAKKNLSDAWQGIKSNFSDAGKELKEDPTRIVPMWFGGMMNALAAGGKTVSTPVNFALQGQGWDAVSSAAGGDPAQAKAYRDAGNMGGEFWEMAGKPLLLLAGGELIGKAGGTVAEDAAINRLRIVRGLMADASAGRTGIDMADAQLAQQALQDAAREVYGTGRKGQSAMAKSLPGRDTGLAEIIKGGPSTVSKVEEGNKSLLELVKKAVDIAGKPADEVNRVYGYLPESGSVARIQADLLKQAADAERNGLKTYAKALKERAESLDGKKTLGQIYDLKKSANRMSGVARNTQEAIDMMDSWDALADAIRQEVYPRYEQMVGAHGDPQLAFQLRQAGRKEGATMKLRNGVEKRWAQAQQQTDALHTPGETLHQMERGITKHHTVFGTAVRKGRETGILRSPQGELNISGKKATGRLSPDTVPESVNMTRPASFQAVGPGRLALPGRTMQFEIPGDFPTVGTEGKIAHSAGQVERHAFESPAFTTSSAPTRTAEFSIEPPIVQFRKDAQAIEDRLPPVQDGYTRLWRGNRPGEEGKNPVFTSDLPGIALPFRKSYGGKLTYVDVPSEEARMYRNSDTLPEYTLPSKFSTKARPVSIPERAGESAQNRRIIAGNEGTAGADVSTARTPEAQTDVAKGPGTLLTNDVGVAKGALQRMERLINSESFDKMPRSEQIRAIKAVRTLRRQIAEYDRAASGGARVAHTAPETSYRPRKTGKLPVGHPLRKAAPAEASSYEREEEYEHR